MILQGYVYLSHILASVFLLVLLISYFLWNFWKKMKPVRLLMALTHTMIFPLKNQVFLYILLCCIIGAFWIRFSKHFIFILFLIRVWVFHYLSIVWFEAHKFFSCTGVFGLFLWVELPFNLRRKSEAWSSLIFGAVDSAPLENGQSKLFSYFFFSFFLHNLVLSYQYLLFAY